MKLFSGSKIICQNLEIADSFYSRFKGLMFRKNFGEYDGLLLKRCNSIHMFFMKFPIDAVFVDKNFSVVKIYEGLNPWMISGFHYNASHVFEFEKGFVKKHNICMSDVLVITS